MSVLSGLFLLVISKCFLDHFFYRKQRIEYISLTAAVDSERAQVIPENYHNTLFIMDAGYMGRELEERIVNSGNHK